MCPRGEGCCTSLSFVFMQWLTEKDSLFSSRHHQEWKLNFDSTQHWASVFIKCNKKFIKILVLAQQVLTLTSGEVGKCFFPTLNTLDNFFSICERKRELITFLFKTGSSFVKDELVDGSELLAEIGERLNKEIAAIKNWRNLAYRLNIPHETYSAFDTSKGKTKSPTKMMFEWLANWKPGLNIGDLLKGIKEIDRADVVEIVTKEAEAGEFVIGATSPFMHFEQKRETFKVIISNLFQYSPSSTILVPFCFRINPWVFFFFSEKLFLGFSAL